MEEGGGMEGSVMGGGGWRDGGVCDGWRRVEGWRGL